MAASGDLRQNMNDLALRVVMEAPAAAGDWTEQLERIRSLAASENSPAVAAAAATALQELRAGSSDATRVQEALAELQSAFEAHEAGNAANPAADPELLTDFVLETNQHLADIEAQTLALERAPSDSEALHAAFRGFHSIKGLAGFLELGVVQETAHEVEAVLDRARDGQLTITPAAIDVILQAADHLQRWTAHVEKLLAGQISTPPARDTALLARIRALCETRADEQEEAHSLAALGSALAPASAPAAPDGEPATPPAVSIQAVNAPEAPPGRAAVQQEPKGAIKVDTAKLDSMVEMAGELVIAESLLRHDSELATVRSPGLQRKMAQLTRITTELQKTAMAMRLVPVGPLFRRMSRLVRDLSRQFGKPVEMELVGSEIELDRTIVEELADPLMHMIRNALDHGIEPPGDRERAGKAAAAHVRLKAQHQAGQVLVEIADDGRGLHREKILRKAIESGLVASGEGMADTDVYNLIFQPGFSTAAQVTSVSGRGVGMDVVRRHIEKLRGRIEIRSTPGKGTAFVIKLPLTLAIIDGLVVGVGTQRYIVPLFAVREMFRPGEDVVWSVQQRAEMALVRGTLLPILRLYRAFKLEPKSERPQDGVLIVAEVEGERFCLLVDQLIGKQEVVIKSLGETFRDIPGLAGGAILGDGRVGLILDLERLFTGRHGDSRR